ncbi:hypothetical protein JTB14_034578 [Gonioctena quinquepunctata]|nr:hypothetical protein JTB14_034578 [Gonioctena quinquepunctata]
MKTIPLYLLALFAVSESEEDNHQRKRRGYFRSTYPIGTNQLRIGGVNVDSYGSTERVMLRGTDLFSPGAGKFHSIPQYAGAIHELHQIPQIEYANSNAVDKPVQESQEFIPPQSTGTAIIPMNPPPATPVNAAAFNVPANGGAVFLGSGSLGVIDLGGGAYALGSGALGYSERRSNPRSSFRAPLLPPVQAAPNLIPAAVNSPPLPPQGRPIVQYSFPVSGQQKPTDENGYEFLPPNQVGFGDPLPPRPLKTRNAFATPTALQLPPQPPQLPQSFQAIQPLESYQSSQSFEVTSQPAQLQPVQPIDSDQSIYGQDVSDLYSSSYL